MQSTNQMNISIKQIDINDDEQIRYMARVENAQRIGLSMIKVEI